MWWFSISLSSFSKRAETTETRSTLEKGHFLHSLSEGLPGCQDVTGELWRLTNHVWPQTGSRRFSIGSISSYFYLWISITSSAIMRPIFPAPALVPPGMPGTVCSARLPPPVRQKQRLNFCGFGLFLKLLVDETSVFTLWGQNTVHALRRHGRLRVIWSLHDGTPAEHTETRFTFQQQRQVKTERVSGYLRHDGVRRDDVLHLLGPRVHKAEPPAPQRDERTVFDFEFVTVGVDLFSHLQNCRHS